MKLLSTLATAAILALGALPANAQFVTSGAEAVQRLRTAFAERRVHTEENSLRVAEEAFTYGSQFYVEEALELHGDRMDGTYVPDARLGYMVVIGETHAKPDQNIYGYCVTRTGREADTNERALDGWVEWDYAIAPYGHGPDYEGAGRATCKTDQTELFNPSTAYSWFN